MMTRLKAVRPAAEGTRKRHLIWMMPGLIIWLCVAGCSASESQHTVTADAETTEVQGNTARVEALQDDATSETSQEDATSVTSPGDAISETSQDSTTDQPPDGGGVDNAICDEADMSELYTQYVEPFVSGAVSQSCSQCHMAGIDISMYAQDTPCQTMACMVNLGAADLTDPASSPILAQILMGDTQSSVFDVATEHTAILEWITWSASCHEEVCGAVSDACNVGTGADSTGINPIGDCSEDELLAVFWDALIIDRGRCVTCHSDYGQELGTFGPCATAEDCWGPQLCIDGVCYSPYPLSAPHFFEGECTGEGQAQKCGFKWNNPEHKQHGLNTMYNAVALGFIDVTSPLDSLLLTKPLLEDFHPTAIYGPGVDIQDIPEGVGTGIHHGGTSKFGFGCHEPPCPTSGVVDCRKDTPCDPDTTCAPGESCIGEPHAYCRKTDSVCDDTYVHTVRFVEYFTQCQGP